MGFTYSQSWRLKIRRPGNFIERRLTPRSAASCEVEVIADLSLLDTESTAPPEQLVFLGETINLSAGGIALTLPSLQIDERFCCGGHLLRLWLHLPQGAVNLGICPVRCSPLEYYGRVHGYLIGSRIVSVLQKRDIFEQYLQKAYIVQS